MHVYTEPSSSLESDTNNCVQDFSSNVLAGIIENSE